MNRVEDLLCRGADTECQGTPSALWGEHRHADLCAKCIVQSAKKSLVSSGRVVSRRRPIFQKTNVNNITNIVGAKTFAFIRAGTPLAPAG